MEVRRDSTQRRLCETDAVCLSSRSMTVLLENRIALAYLAYLGYPHSSNSSVLLPTTSALTITRPRKQDRKKGTTARSVFLVYVLGAAGSGKTTLLKSFIGKGFDNHYEPTLKVKTVVNAVEIGGEEKYLVVRSFILFASRMGELTVNQR